MIDTEQDDVLAGLHTRDALTDVVLWFEDAVKRMWPPGSLGKAVVAKHHSDEYSIHSIDSVTT